MARESFQQMNVYMHVKSIEEYNKGEGKSEKNMRLKLRKRFLWGEFCL